MILGIVILILFYVYAIFWFHKEFKGTLYCWKKKKLWKKYLKEKAEFETKRRKWRERDEI